MRVDLLIRYKWFEIVEGQLLDPERDLALPNLRLLFTYPTREDALAALSQYLDGQIGDREFTLLEVFGLE